MEADPTKQNSGRGPVNRTADFMRLFVRAQLGEDIRCCSYDVLVREGGARVTIQHDDDCATWAAIRADKAAR